MIRFVFYRHARFHHCGLDKVDRRNEFGSCTNWRVCGASCMLPTYNKYSMLTVYLMLLTESSMLTDELPKRERKEGERAGKTDINVPGAGPSTSVSSVSSPDASHGREVCVFVCSCSRIYVCIVRW